MPTVAERRLARFATFASFVLIIAVLRFAADVIIPLAIASLLAFLLSPLVVWLGRRGLPKVLAIAVTVTFVFSIIGALGWLVVTQGMSLAERLPDYEQNIRGKLDRVAHPQTPGKLSRTSEMLENLQRDLEQPDPGEKPETPPGEAAPIPVQIRGTERSPLSVISGLVGPVLGPLAVAGIVIVFVVAMLIQRDDLRDRFIKIVSSGQLNLATQALDDAARRVTRYLLMQLVVNATYGVPVGVALYFIGVPNAVLWGVLATLLRFIPFLGPWIAATFPVALAIAVDPGWTMVLWTLGVFIFMEVVSNNIVEVKLYGTSTGISNLALLVAAVFWTWLWGPAGLFLSTPLTVCLLVIGRHVPGLKLLSMLLGSAPVLEPPAQFYQRMLSMDAEEMLDLARKYIAERSLVAFYDEVFIPALRMAEADREEGSLAEVRQKFIIHGGRDLIEELSHDDTDPRPGQHAPSAESSSASPRITLGVPARDDADELVSLMLTHVLLAQGFAAETIALAEASRPEEHLRSRHPDVVIISALPPSAVTAARQVYRRLRRHVGDARFLFGIWDCDASPVSLERRLSIPDSHDVVTSLNEAVAALTQSETDSATAADALLFPATPGGPPPRLEEWFEQLIRDLARSFGVPVSLVSLVERDAAFWRTHATSLPSLAKATEATRNDDLCAAVIAEDDGLLVAEDITKDRRLTDNPTLTEGGVRFYAGAVLRIRGGHPVGILCVSDTHPRTPPPDAVQRLRAGAERLAELIELREAA